jgi:hypothetical protein
MYQEIQKSLDLAKYHNKHSKNTFEEKACLVRVREGVNKILKDC